MFIPKHRLFSLQPFCSVVRIRCERGNYNTHPLGCCVKETQSRSLLNRKVFLLLCECSRVLQADMKHWIYFCIMIRNAFESPDNAPEIQTSRENIGMITLWPVEFHLFPLSHPPLSASCPPHTSFSDAKVYMNECCECVWESSKSGSIQNPPLQTQQGAGAEVKNTRGHSPLTSLTSETHSLVLISN